MCSSKGVNHWTLIWQRIKGRQASKEVEKLCSEKKREGFQNALVGGYWQGMFDVANEKVGILCDGFKVISGFLWLVLC